MKIPLLLGAVVLCASLLLTGCSSPSGNGPGPSSSKDITSFEIDTVPPSVGSISGSFILVQVPETLSSLANLTATFTTTGVSVKVGSTIQVSHWTTNDFTYAVTYKVTAEDGTSRSYSVRAASTVYPNRYLPNLVVTHAQQTTVVNNNFRLSIPNPFSDHAPTVLLGNIAPTGIAQATAYYATVEGPFDLGTHVLEDSSKNPITGVGDISIYGLDWTWIGTASCSTNLFTADASHNLLAGDTVYIAPLAGTTLTRGAYLVETAPSTTTFTLHGVTLANGSLNFLAKVNSTPGAVPY